ncbi:MAG: alanine racemase [Clostridia bacterium]|nr:alanine racemase [Clostridia bacterium]
MSNIRGIRRRTWAEIDLDKAKENYTAVRDAVGEGVKICCVIKANAYGHGAVRMAAFYEQMGADYLAVSNIEEALQLREKNIKTPLLILGYTPEECAGVLSLYNITQTVYSYDYGKRLAEVAERLSVKVKIHVKIDTGMGRIGFLCREGGDDELADAALICRELSLIPEGIFTHFAVADENTDGDEFTAEQLRLFNSAVERLGERGITFDIRHAANSAAIFDHPESHLDMVRAGVVLYGLKPSEKMRALPPLRPIMSLKSVVSHIKEVRTGQTVSYGRTFFANRNTTVATVPIGYADGLWRVNGTNDCYMLVNGKYAPIIGRICMDQLMLDVSELDCRVGDFVTVFGADSVCSADAIARRNGTINYEIVCAIGERVPRAFIEDGRITEWQDSIYKEDLT